ncbi:hypothetical protein K440DRAFT_612271 [Wilcoxina mikolae CBS 423.85]|nr:hypothetical protein K440DRAFT_612271 [Wilcoxina mikolae CBS 423.85]
MRDHAACYVFSAYCSERNGSDVTRHRVPSRPLIFSCSPKLSVTLHIIAALTPVVR